MRSGADLEPPASVRTLALAAVVFVTTLCLLPAYLLAAFAPTIKVQLGLSPVGYAAAVTTYFGVSSLAATVTGRLVDRLGSVAVLRVSMLPAAAALTVVPLSHHVAGAIAAMALGGLANATSSPACSHYLSSSVPDHRLGFVFGLRQAAVPFSSLVSGLAAAGLGQLVGWRAVFLGGAACALLTIPAVRPLPEVARAEPRPAELGVLLEPGPKDSRSLAPLAWTGVMATAAASITVAFSVISASEIGGSVTAAALLLAGGSLASMVTRIEAGRRATGTAHIAMRAVSVVCLLGAVGALLMSAAIPAVLIPATLLLFGFGTGWPGLLVYTAVSTNRTRPGHAAGVIEASMNFGAGAGPLLFGVLLASQGLRIAWLLPAALFAGAAVLMHTTRRRRSEA
jgi:MFS family permease